MQIHVANFICKLIGYSFIFSLVALALPSLYPTPGPLLWSVGCLTIVGTIADATIVPRLGNIKSLALGLPGMTIVVWVVANISQSAHVNVPQAILLAICVSPLEFTFHHVILRRMTIYSSSRGD